MKKTKLFFILLSVSVMLTALAGCSHYNSKMTKMQQSLTKTAGLKVGFPAVANFQQRRILKLVYEVSDKPTTTYTYIMDLYGKMHLLCNSIGYAIPYDTQYTNPEQVKYASNNHPITVPSADPDGLYHAPNSKGSWVDCVNPKTKKEALVYVEQDVTTSPFKLRLAAK